jgi:hypothetical protein
MGDSVYGHRCDGARIDKLQRQMGSRDEVPKGECVRYSALPCDRFLGSLFSLSEAETI